MGSDSENISRNEGPGGGFVERRQEPRFDVPEVYRRYITLRVKSGGAFIDASLGSFSRHGIMFKIPAAFEQEERVDCFLSIAESLSREVAFSICVKSCQKKNDGFVVRAVIETIADAIWFEVFTEVHDFIIEREGTVY